MFGKSTAKIENLYIFKLKFYFCVHAYISKSTQRILLQFYLIDWSSFREGFNMQYVLEQLNEGVKRGERIFTYVYSRAGTAEPMSIKFGH